MLLLRDRRNKKAIRDLQASLPNNRKAELDQGSLNISGLSNERHELPPGFDRGELPTGREHQELP